MKGSCASWSHREVPRIRILSALAILAISFPSTQALAQQDSVKGRDDDDSSVSVVSPTSGYATNAQTLRVTVDFHVRESHEPENRRSEIAVWLDRALVAVFEVPRGVSSGTHEFAVDVARHPDAIVHLWACLASPESVGERSEASRCRNDARSQFVKVILDKTPPQLTVSTPLSNQIVSSSSVEVRGTATDKLSGVKTLTINGIPVAVSGGKFQTLIALQYSVNDIIVAASDFAGNNITTRQQVIFTSAVTSRPTILSTPPTTAIVGRPMTYRVVAASIDPRTLKYSMASAPSGASINSSGIISWIPTSAQSGEQSLSITVADSAGEVSQSFPVSVFDTRPVASAVVSATNGGVVAVDDAKSAINGLRVVIPANALSSDRVIAVSEVLTGLTLGGSERYYLRGVLIEPDGTPLSLPATITLPYDPSAFGTNSGIAVEEFLGGYYLDEGTGTLTAVQGFTVDSASHVLSGSVPHFSIYFLANQARLCPPPSTLTDCPGFAPTPLQQTPAILIHGFQASGQFGDESTWGNLRYLLAGVIDAWRFDWDSSYTPFELSGAHLAAAISAVKTLSAHSGVNLVAHSFGGILARTYLEGKALVLKPPYGNLPYRGDVGKLMTIGTPHQGIGGANSVVAANICARAPGRIQPVTCFEANTGAASLPGEGSFLSDLNSSGLPPQLQVVVRGNILASLGQNTFLGADDGLITLAGSSVPVPNGVVTDKIIAASTTAPVGLCHSGVLFSAYYGTCPSALNVAMVEINDRGHPLWNDICTFLGGTDSQCSNALLTLTAANWTAAAIAGDGYQLQSALCGVIGGQECGTSFPNDVPFPACNVFNQVGAACSVGVGSFGAASSVISSTADSKNPSVVTNAQFSYSTTPSSISFSGSASLSPDTCCAAAGQVVLVVDFQVNTPILFSLSGNASADCMISFNAGQFTIGVSLGNPSVSPSYIYSQTIVSGGTYSVPFQTASAIRLSPVSPPNQSYALTFVVSPNTNSPTSSPMQCLASLSATASFTAAP
jgi:pimeloyl-ACP methyl ester carboxylesterase